VHQRLQRLGWRQLTVEVRGTSVPERPSFRYDAEARQLVRRAERAILSAS
jgi:hypothetical protein